MTNRIFAVFKRIGLKVLAVLSPNLINYILISCNRILGRGLIFSHESEVRIISSALKSLKSLDYVYMDIGANIGNYTRELRKQFSKSKILAFEPSKATFQALELNLDDIAGVECINLALSDHSGQDLLFSNEPLSGLASLTQRDLGRFGIDFDLSESVSVNTLDDYLNSHKNEGPFILKLDVEGQELKVLEGSKQTLTRTALIQFEFGGTNLDSRVFYRDLYKFFEASFFYLYRLKPNGAYLITKYNELDELPLNSTYYAVNSKYLYRLPPPRLIRL